VAIGISASGGIDLGSPGSIPHPGRLRLPVRPAGPQPGEEAPVPKATWNGAVIADSDDTVVVEGNHYFPRESVRADVLRDSETRTVCPWKGTASYYTLEVNGVTNPDAAWYYPRPTKAARRITDRIAFWRDVEITT
jgi:uncharacterized protein (DUF427 family)